MTRLRGITWDHPRGYNPLVASQDPYFAATEVMVEWEKRSLKEFGDASIEKLARQFDLLVIDHPHMGVAHASGCLKALDELLPMAAVRELAGQSAGPSFQSYSYRNKLWALPIDAAFQVAAFRPNLLGDEVLPRSWEDVERLASSLSRKNLTVGMALCPTDTLCSFLTLSAQEGNPPQAGKAELIDRETGLRVLEKLRRLKNSCHPDSLGWNPIKLFDAMSSGDDIAYAPLAFGYTNYSRQGFRGNKLTFTAIPGLKGSLLGGAGIAVSAWSQHPEASADYALWLAGAPFQMGGYTESGGQPANIHAWLSEKNNRLTGDFFKNTLPVLEASYMRPRLPGWPDFQEYLGERVHAFLINDEEPQRVLDDLQEQYSRSLDAHVNEDD